ncbi:hypothetical protein CH296_26795 [Rhodococcus sp. 14-2496-1d]|nr:hypothetical protein CH296_26795 [Rhodococcus sp. 14-2496-1d]
MDAIWPDVKIRYRAGLTSTFLDGAVTAEFAGAWQLVVMSLAHLRDGRGHSLISLSDFDQDRSADGTYANTLPLAGSVES